MYFVGDVHGKIFEYKHALALLPKDAKSLQIGDMGLGFTALPHQEPRHRFIRGNHDSPKLCYDHPNYLFDYGVFSDDMFAVAGAWSVDWKWRTPGVSWWWDEELFDSQFEDAYRLYVEAKPRIMVSHECPSKATQELLAPMLLRGKGDIDYFAMKTECGQSRTAKWLQRMFDAHQPQHWVFGHYHIDSSFQIGGTGTAFHCLAELSVKEIV